MMVQRSENGQTTNRVGNLFEHNTTLGSFTKHYLFGGKLIAMREGLTANSTVSFFATDHLGSTTTTLRANGSLRSRLRYDPWGKERYAQYATPSGYRYTSQRWDSGLGLYDYNARYYDPVIGKFISADTLVPDPVNPQQYNRYTYSLNSPLVLIDPSGHCAQYAGVNDAELSACLEAWNSLGNSYLDLWQLGGMESYPNELMNELLQNGTTDEIQILLDTMDTSVSTFREYKWNKMHSGCTPTWGGAQKCAPDGGWPKYAWTDEDTEWLIERSVEFVAGTVTGFGVRKIIGKVITDRVAAWIISRMIQIPVNKLIEKSITSETFSSLDTTPILPATGQDPREKPSFVPDNNRWNANHLPWLNIYELPKR